MTAPRPGCPDPEVLTALVDAELDHGTRDAVLAHLAGCAACRADADAERRTSAAVRDLPAAVPSDALVAALRGMPVAQRGATSADTDELGAAARRRDARAAASARRSRKAPALVGAVASIVVFAVGGVAFVGAVADSRTPSSSGGSGGATTAVVPAADELTQEHALTTVQTGFGGPGFSTVPVSVSQVVESPAVVP